MGDAHGDQTRNIKGEWRGILGRGILMQGFSGEVFSGPYTAGSAVYDGNIAYNSGSGSSKALAFDSGRAVPTGSANAPRRWGALACAYLGIPAS